MGASCCSKPAKQHTDKSCNQRSEEKFTYTNETLSPSTQECKLTPITQYKFDVDDFFDIEIADENHSVEQLDSLSLRTSCDLRCKRLLITDEHLQRREQKHGSTRRASTEDGVGVVSEETRAAGRTPPRSKSESDYLRDRCVGPTLYEPTPHSNTTHTTVLRAPEVGTMNRDADDMPRLHNIAVLDHPGKLTSAESKLGKKIDYNHPSSKYAVIPEHSTHYAVSARIEPHHTPPGHAPPRKTAEFSIQLPTSSPPPSSDHSRVTDQQPIHTSSHVVNLRGTHTKPTAQTTAHFVSSNDHSRHEDARHDARHEEARRTPDLVLHTNRLVNHDANKTPPHRLDNTTSRDSPPTTGVPVARVKPSPLIDDNHPGCNAGSPASVTYLHHDSPSNNTTPLSTSASLSRDSGVFTNSPTSPTNAHNTADISASSSFQSAASSSSQYAIPSSAIPAQIAIAETWSENGDGGDDIVCDVDVGQCRDGLINENDIVFQMIEETTKELHFPEQESLQEQKQSLNELWTEVEMREANIVSRVSANRKYTNKASGDDVSLLTSELGDLCQCRLKLKNLVDGDNIEPDLTSTNLLNESTLKILLDQSESMTEAEVCLALHDHDTAWKQLYNTQEEKTSDDQLSSVLHTSIQNAVGEAIAEQLADENAESTVKPELSGASSLIHEHILRTNRLRELKCNNNNKFNMTLAGKMNAAKQKHSNVDISTSENEEINLEKELFIKLKEICGELNLVKINNLINLYKNEINKKTKKTKITEQDAATLVAKEKEMLAKLKLFKSQERARLNEKLAAKLNMKVQRQMTKL